MNNKTFLVLFSILFISIISSSVPSLGTFKQNSDIELKQTCTINGTFCDLCNISSVDYPDGTRAVYDVEMTKRNADFNYTLDKQYTINLGEYRVNGYCAMGSDVLKNWVYYFDVTPSGQGGSSNIAFYILVIILIYGATFLSFFWARNIPMTILTGMLMIFLGIYLIRYGVIIYRDTLTNYLSYVTISLGFMFSSWATLEQFDLL